MRYLAAVMFFMVLGRVGEMDRRNQEAVEAFRHEWVAVHNERGEPVLVAVRGGGHGQDTLRNVSERAQLRAAR